MSLVTSLIYSSGNQRMWTSPLLLILEVVRCSALLELSESTFCILKNCFIFLPSFATVIQTKTSVYIADSKSWKMPRNNEDIYIICLSLCLSLHIYIYINKYIYMYPCAHMHAGKINSLKRSQQNSGLKTTWVFLFIYLEKGKLGQDGGVREKWPASYSAEQLNNLFLCPH